MTADEWLEWARYHTQWLPVGREAAEIIERQAAESRNLQAALRPFGSGGEWETIGLCLMAALPAEKSSSASAQLARLRMTVDAVLKHADEKHH